MEAKVILLGDANVGKTSVLLRFVRDKFDAKSTPTIAPEYDSRQQRSLQLKIWDITGQDRFRTVVKSYYRGAHGCMLICDQTNEESLRSLHLWYQELVNVVGPIPTLVLCNKSDEQLRIADGDLQSFNDKYQLLGWRRVSAKTGENVRAAFERLAEVMESSRIEEQIETQLSLTEAPRKTWC